MALEQKKELIHCYAELDQFVGRRVSMNQTAPDSWHTPPDLFPLDRNKDVDYEHTPGMYPKTYVACADLPRIEGTLKKSSGHYGVFFPEQSISFYIVDEGNFFAADIELLD